MKLKKIAWNVINKIVTHDNFASIHQQTFTNLTSPSLRDELKNNKALNLNAIYQDIEHNKLANTSTPIFITARFRSGSTLLWNLFRHIENLHSYYEPLNERMWFDKTQRQAHTDKSHIGVDDYWSEYEHITHVGELFSRNWTYKNLLMDQTSFDPNLYKYIDALIQQSPKRAVLQFNRIDFRLPWLRTHFSQAKIIHLYRHPRDLWISVSSKSAPIGLQLSGHDYSTYNIFYTMEWAQNLSTSFPFLSPSTGKHPYYYHYLLWRLSYIYGKTYADISISFEDLINNTNKTLTNLFDCVNLQDVNSGPLENLVIQQKFGNWKNYADNDWFEQIELECEHILDCYFS